MKLVIQRVTDAMVRVEGIIISEIKTGLVILIGIDKSDEADKIPYFAKKVAEMRVFSDSEGKMNLSVKDVQGEALVVSQFTLCANTERGRRPDFFNAAAPERANELYELFAEKLEKEGVPVKRGKFGASMQLSLTNYGPVTIILES